jgi:NAD dependent epimerase/dehydratase family enzyme
LFGEGAEPLLGGQWGVPRALQQVGFEFRYAQVRSALRAVLGVEQRR